MGVCVLYACREVTAFLGLPCPFSPRDPVSHNFPFSLWILCPESSGLFLAASFSFLAATVARSTLLAIWNIAKSTGA